MDGELNLLVACDRRDHRMIFKDMVFPERSLWLWFDLYWHQAELQILDVDDIRKISNFSILQVRLRNYGNNCTVEYPINVRANDSKIFEIWIFSQLFLPPHINCTKYSIPDRIHFV